MAMVTGIEYIYHCPKSVRFVGWDDFLIRLDDGRDVSLKKIMQENVKCVFEFSYMQSLPVYFFVLRIAGREGSIHYKLGPLEGKRTTDNVNEIGKFLMVIDHLAYATGRRISFKEEE